MLGLPPPPSSRVLCHCPHAAQHVSRVGQQQSEQASLSLSLSALGRNLGQVSEWGLEEGAGAEPVAQWRSIRCASRGSSPWQLLGGRGETHPAPHTQTACLSLRRAGASLQRLSARSWATDLPLKGCAVFFPLLELIFRHSGLRLPGGGGRPVLRCASVSPGPEPEPAPSSWERYAALQGFWSKEGAVVLSLHPDEPLRLLSAESDRCLPGPVLCALPGSRSLPNAVGLSGIFPSPATPDPFRGRGQA